MHWMVEVEEKNEQAVRAALKDIGVVLSDEPPEPLNGGSTLIFCEAPKKHRRNLLAVPGVIEAMPDIAYDPPDDPLSGCDEPEPEPLPPLVGCDLIEGDEEMDD